MSRQQWLSVAGFQAVTDTAQYIAHFLDLSCIVLCDDRIALDDSGGAGGMSVRYLVRTPLPYYIWYLHRVLFRHHEVSVYFDM